MRIGVLLTSASILAGVSAQSTVVPSAAATIRPPTTTTFYTGNVFFSTTSTTTVHDSHSQSIVDAADIAAPAAVWNSLQFRRPTGLGNVCPITTTNVTIVMSISPTAGLSATTAYAANHGATPVTVFSGALNLPSASSSTWPEPWQAPVPFSVPMAWATPGTGSLVIDILQTANTATASWYLEATTPDNGRLATTYFTGSCRFSNGLPANGVSYSSIILPGRTWGPTYSNILPGAPGIGFIGAYGPGGNWNGIPLPLDLGPFGAPNCIVSSSIEITQAMVANASGAATWSPSILIPNDPALAGTDFHTHSLWIDLLANALGLVTGYGGRWHIGTGIGAPGSFVSTVGNTAQTATTGTLARGTLPTFQLNP